MEIGKHCKSGGASAPREPVIRHLPEAYHWSGGSEARFGVVVWESGLISVVAVKLCSQRSGSGIRVELLKLNVKLKSPAQWVGVRV